ncbi:MAG: RagB/SusD family nutrient uptake outer membrane protein [Candidatus Ordinivivax streblomastigis]|uniref:RagB/SusD family nutrient uptake outer membrane protein n=1 Tax=Candidatus Ordinivivax streblomastigis TaxID=2540710 RepID=A0A5M8P1E0_9BACT|nr:MAG: RagB/SusD family nutrient uptake outer membrane protein [Candidatus Ordinivivax streblomastigis]
MKRIMYLYLVVVLSCLSSCVDLDIPPKTILSDEDIYNPTGMEAYMVGLYRRLPMDDYNVNNNNKDDRQGYFGGWEIYSWPMISTGETVCRHITGMSFHYAGYWREGWKIIRDANRLIENLPQYVDQMPAAQEWLAEAKFIRAYVYFTMAKRYGGLPLIEHLQAFTPDFEKLNVARSSCQDTYDFILNDLKEAEDGMSKVKLQGRANAFVATALKSKVALFAASIAKYGENYVYSVGDVMLCGIPKELANDYYTIAWQAARSLDAEYSLVGDGETDPEAQEKNFESVFTNANESPESIFIRKYDPTFYTHSFDMIYRPARLCTDAGDRFGVTLDWMELFDGEHFNDEANTGRLDLLYNEKGKSYYKVYKHAGELYEGAEPRLRASIMVPGKTYNGAFIDMRRGVIKVTVDSKNSIEKLFPDDYETRVTYSDPSNQPGKKYYDGNIVYQNEVNRPGQQTEEDMYKAKQPSGDSIKIYKNGLDGPGVNNSFPRAVITGIQGRKWIDLNLSIAAADAYGSTQSWIDIRYAEVLLNRAEAAIELYQSGVTAVSYEGLATNTRTDAFEVINRVRQRAGATLLAGESELSTEPAYNRPGSAVAAGETFNPGKGGFVYAPNRGIQIIRVERYKELAFEHKLYWDLRRWFSFHIQINKYRRRMLNPFLFSRTAHTFFDGLGKEVPDGEYIYDARICERADNELNFPINGSGVQTYYEYIPTAEMKKNPLLHGNRGQ